MAVYTEVSDDALIAFLKRYDVGDLKSYKGIAEGVENTNYILTTTEGPFILTLYEKRVAPDDLPYFLGLMEHLANEGLSCPVPVRDCTGTNLNPLAGRQAALVTFLDGVWPRKPKPVHCAEVGAALADLHTAGRSFAMTRANGLGPKDWRPLYAKVADQVHGLAPELPNLIEGELDLVERTWQADLPTGVIHADLFPDNVFFIGEKLSGLIDFYFACNDVLAYDLAICLNAWCFEPDYSFNVTKGRALLKNYHAHRPLTDAELDAFPRLARAAALRFLLTRCYDWFNTPEGAVVSPHNPIDYLRRLRFHQTVQSISQYGFAMESASGAQA